MGGLILFSDSKDVPEGASPRTWDTDFSVGFVRSRDGLVSVYSYATTLVITGVSLVYGVATFTYSGVEPTVNEGFVLSGFSGPLNFLNGMIVFVDTVNSTQFTANVIGSDITISGIIGSAVSLSGQFLGPNLGGSAVGGDWTNVSGILGNTTYAQATSGSATNSTEIPSTADNHGAFTPMWTNPGNAVAGGSSVATVTLSIAANSGGGGGGQQGGGQQHGGSSGQGGGNHGGNSIL